MSFLSQTRPPAPLGPRSAVQSCLQVCAWPVPGTALSSAPAPSSSSGGHTVLAHKLGPQPRAPLGSPLAVAAAGSRSATTAAEAIAKTNGVSGAPLWSLSPRRWPSGAGGILDRGSAPTAQPGPRTRPCPSARLPQSGPAPEPGSHPQHIPAPGHGPVRPPGSPSTAQPGPGARPGPSSRCGCRAAGQARAGSRAPALRAAGSGLARQRWPGARRGRPAGFAR